MYFVLVSLLSLLYILEGLRDFGGSWRYLKFFIIVKGAICNIFSQVSISTAFLTTADVLLVLSKWIIHPYISRLDTSPK